MSAITYKCPNCDADLTYRPATGDFGCAYCGSSFSEAQLEQIQQQQNIIDEQQAQEGNEFTDHAVLYTCPSCGAELVTDDTTAATFCFYCHNPVIMQGRLSGDMQPDAVIPFAVSKEEVKEKLLGWCKGKKYIDDGFISDMQLEKLTGVYFPFWLADSRVNATLTANTTSLKVWVLGNIEYTETSQYAITRGGTLDINDITLKALNREDAELLNGVYPYDFQGLKPFKMSFLSGFFAEKRNLEQKEVVEEAAAIIKNSAETLLENTIGGYGAVSSKNTTINSHDTSWQYVLLPAWMMTYRYKNELYYFAMNGQSGKIAGRVPVSKKKLNKLFWTVAACVTVGMALFGAFAGGLL